MQSAAEIRFSAALDAIAADGQVIQLWLRDDDATMPTDKLSALLDVCQSHRIPILLAVIPKTTDATLAKSLADYDKNLIRIAVHGWSHHNHAPATEKKQELGPHRPVSEVLTELKAGISKLAQLYGDQFEPMLVPPWNRISPAIVEALPDLGFHSVSTFQDRKSGWKADQAIPFHDTHLDIMDWKAGGVGKECDALFDEMTGLILKWGPETRLGVLTHHLVHDEAATHFLSRLFALTAPHSGCTWIDPSQLA